MPGRLYLCATPIGNLGDASPRLAETLAGVDVIFAEDTRRTGKLLAALGITASVRSFFAGNERRRSDELASELAAGASVALVTDAGTPAVSDPGVRAVAAARQVGAEVVVIPGPSAVTAAVAGSGMVEGPFTFCGFLARRGRERTDQLAAMAFRQVPMVVFLSPHRVRADLASLAEACGDDRQVCVARELTKIHEELWWGSLAEAMSRWATEEPRGEFTLVVAAGRPEPVSMEEAVALARRHMDEGMSVSQAAREASGETGRSRRQIYDALIS